MATAKQARAETSHEGVVSASRSNAMTSDHPDDFKVFYMREPQFHPDHGKLLPGDKVLLAPDEAARWERLGLVYKDGDQHRGKSLRERIEEAEAEARERVLAEMGASAQENMVLANESNVDRVRPQYREAQRQSEEVYARGEALLTEDERAAQRGRGRRASLSPMESDPDTREALRLRRERQFTTDNQAAGPAVVASEAFHAEQEGEAEGAYEAPPRRGRGSAGPTTETARVEE